MKRPLDIDQELSTYLLGNNNRSPGVSTITGFDRAPKWDVKEADGEEGGTSTLKGESIRRGQISTYLADDGGAGENATAGLANARAVGDGALVQRHSRDAANLTTLIARLEKTARDDETTLHVPRAEIDSAIASIEERYQTICDRPFVCAECGRSIRLRDAEGN